MSEVVDWDPKSLHLSTMHVDVLDVLTKTLEAEQFSMTDQQRDLLRPVIGIDSDGWYEFSKSFPAERLVNWIKVLVLGSSRYTDLESGAKSPVIPLIKILRERGQYDPALTTWIKAHSTNKFLPYGSLADRL